MRRALSCFLVLSLLLGIPGGEAWEAAAQTVRPVAPLPATLGGPSGAVSGPVTLLTPEAQALPVLGLSNLGLPGPAVQPVVAAQPAQAGVGRLAVSVSGAQTAAPKGALAGGLGSAPRRTPEPAASGTTGRAPHAPTSVMRVGRRDRRTPARAPAESQDAELGDLFDGEGAHPVHAVNASGVPAGGEGGDGGDGKKEKKPELHRLPFEEQLEALLDKYKVPAGDRPLRRRLTLEAVERIRADIPLFARKPRLKVEFGPWWLTLQDLTDPNLKEIQIPLEDIFVRAVDERGVREAVGAAAHEVMHYSITRPDLEHPLTLKYAVNTSPPANNLLYQHLEDARINSWGLIQLPGLKPYFDEIYEAMWPEDPGAAARLKDSRIQTLRRSTLRVTKAGGAQESWMAPHLQYVNSILYHWRHHKLAPYLTDPMAKSAFERTLPALERVRLTHPQAMGGVLLEEMKRRASTLAMETLDREIYPEYKKLIEESERQLSEMQKDGSKVDSNPEEGEGDGQPGQPNMDKREGPTKPTPREILDKMDKDLREMLERHGRKGDGDARSHGALPEPGKVSPEGEPASPVQDESWAERRAKAVAQRQAIEQGMTDYERYRRRAQELGLITHVDGMVKKLLLPTKHARLSRLVYHEGDEPDMNKYYDDVAQGKLDAPMMRRWNRRVKRTAKISLVLDISGSMGKMSAAMESKLDQALIAVVAWIEVCQKNGLEFELMLFADKPDTIHAFGKSIDKTEKDRILKMVGGHGRGGTAIGAAFKAALDSLAKQPATHRFVIFATDEDHNSGDAPEKYAALAKQLQIVTIAMVIGASDAAYKHFDYRVPVKEAKDLPRELMQVLGRALRAMLGPMGAAYGFALTLAPMAMDFLNGVATFGFGDVGEPAPAPQPKAEPSAAQTWDGLRLLSEQTLSLTLPPTGMVEWRLRTAQTLRQRPGADLRTAVVDALAQTYALDAAQRNAVDRMLAGRPVLEDTLSRNVEWVGFAGGTLYALRSLFPSGEPRVLERTAEGWRSHGELPESVRQIFEYRGRAHVVTHEGVLRREGERWRVVVSGSFSAAYPAGEELFVVANRVLYRVDGKKRIAMMDAFPISEVRLNADGGIYAATGEGLFRMEPSAGSVWSAPFRWLGMRVLGLLEGGYASGMTYWSPALRETEPKLNYDERDRPYVSGTRTVTVQRSVVAGGVLWAHTGSRLMRLTPAGKWLVDTIPGDAVALTELDGAPYAASEYGVYRYENGAWQRVLEGLAGGPLGAGAGMLALGGPGVRVWPARHVEAVKGWQDRVLADLGSFLTAAKPKPPVGGLALGRDELEDESGRPLFGD